MASTSTTFLMTLCLQPDVGRAVAAGVSDLVGQNRTVGFFAKVHQEVLVDREAAFNRVHVDHHHHRTFPKDGRTDRRESDRQTGRQTDRETDRQSVSQLADR